MMQRAKLMAQISQKSKDINDVEKRNALHVELLEKIFLQNSTADKLGLIKSKFKEEYKDVRKFNEKYALRLMKEDSVFMSVSEEEIRALAVARGKSVVQYMVEKQHIEPSRIVVEAPKEDSDAKDRVVKTKLDIVVK
jgi:pantoate kinase